MTATAAPDPGSSTLAGDILILSNYYHPEPTGSAPPVSDLSFWLAEQRLSPAVLTARPSYPKNAVYEGYGDGQYDLEDLQGVSVRRVASFVPRSRGMVGRLLAETSFAASALLSRRRKYKGVICICPSVFVILIAPLFRKKGGRVLAIVHDIQSGLAASLKFGRAGFLMRLLQHLETFALNRCDEVIALTAAMATELRSIGVTKPITVIPPQVDVHEIVPVPPKDHGSPTAIYSGNLGRKQGLDQVINLALELQQRGSETQVVVRGEGSERAALEDQALALGLMNISFADLASRSEISAALGAATIHLVPQSPEGANFALPSKIFSIMAAQRAYVATANPGTPLDLITRESGAGVCIEPNRPKQFADAVERLVADEIYRSHLAQSGRRFAETVVNRHVVCQRILELLGPTPEASSTARSK